ncbi:hypothetical protein B0H12DRAFT_587695 [Mycena haematopus]|nr:hypothetical protein B0H12DRAFT_587695 [Mycena haematopus]
MDNSHIRMQAERVFCCICSLPTSVLDRPPKSRNSENKRDMPTADEVKQLEGVSAAQHRFRLAVNAPDAAMDNNGSTSASLVPTPPRPPTDQGNNTPFLYGQLPFRNSRYKEKFQALREKYDRVITKQQEYQQDLEIATAKIKKLQAENEYVFSFLEILLLRAPTNERGSHLVCYSTR